MWVVMKVSLLSLVSWLAVSGGAVSSAAGSEVAGHVAAVWGELRLVNGEHAKLLEPGMALSQGDVLRTGELDRAKLVFKNDSVIDLAPGTEIVVARQRVDSDASKFDSLVQLGRGKIRARLARRVDPAASRYQVETPTAVVVKGSDFIVLYDEALGQSDVVAVRGEVEVLGRLSLMGGVVTVHPQEKTVARRGRYPVAAEGVPREAFQEYLRGFAIIGTGGRDGLDVQHPAVTGRLLSPRDLPGIPAAATARKPAPELQIGAPPVFLGDEMSDDMRVLDEPLLEYERRQPGLPLPDESGGVRVEF